MIYITKASGEKVRYSEKKIRNSLQRAGASNEQIDFIVKEIASKLYEGISTKQIYRIAFNMLKSGARHMAARYHLKNAIMELGPSGFPFEKFFAEILSCQGYKTTIGQVVQGKCITHEIDVIAEKGNLCYVIECKYHNQRGKINDVQIPLYIQSRFKDVEEQRLTLAEHKNKVHSGWVVTNTRFSSDAIRYGTCAGLNLLGWDYPENKGLKEQVDHLGLHPITCLTSLTKAEKKELLDKKIVLCREVTKELLETSGIKSARIYIIMEEVDQLCHHILNKQALASQKTTEQHL